MANQTTQSPKYSAIGSAIFMLVAFAVVAALTYGIRSWFKFANLSVLGGHLNVIMLILGALYYLFCAYLYSFVTESDAIFGKYQPIGKTVSEVKSYILRCYREADVPGGARKAVTISLILHLILTGLASLLWTPFFLNYLFPLPILSLGYLMPKKEFKIEDDFLQEFVEKRTGMKTWRDHICPRCNTINNGRGFIGESDRTETHTAGVDNYTTERDYYEGDTHVYETTYHSDPYIRTNYSYNANYRCARCKYVYIIHHSGSTKTSL